MKRKLIFLTMFILICACMSLICSATTSEFVSDGADLLTNAEERKLAESLSDLSEKYGAQIAVVTVQKTDGSSVDSYVEKIYDVGTYGMGEDKAGVLLLVCMNPREYRILSNGFAADAITMEYIDNISDTIVSYLSDGDYSKAFDVFADECEYYLDGYLNGFPFEFGINLLLSLIVGLVVGLIVVSSMKAQLKSVHRQNQANAYVKAGSMNITRAGDYFMYRTVVRTAKPQNNSSSSSSRSGSSRNVGGGRF